MATSRKKRVPRRVRFTLDLSDAEKDAFCGRLSAVRDQITPSGLHTLNNRELLSALFDLVDKHSHSTQPSVQCASTGSFLKNTGKLHGVS